jgi:dienelactone hydrolase
MGIVGFSGLALKIEIIGSPHPKPTNKRDNMLIQDDFCDVQTTTNEMRIFLYVPINPNYPSAKYPGIVVFTEIYQVTEPVARFCRQIAGQGYVVAACSSFHEFTSYDAIPYDTQGKCIDHKSLLH